MQSRRTKPNIRLARLQRTRVELRYVSCESLACVSRSARLRLTRSSSFCRVAYSCWLALLAPNFDFLRGFIICRSGLSDQSSQQAALQTSSNWVLTFKPEVDVRAIEAVCVEAELPSQGRFDGRCRRLHTGSVLKVISGVRFCMNSIACLLACLLACLPAENLVKDSAVRSCAEGLTSAMCCRVFHIS